MTTRHTIAILTAALLLGGCAQTATQGTHTLTIGADEEERAKPRNALSLEELPTPSHALITAFLNAMIKDDDSTDSNNSLRSYMSPRYVKANNLENHKVDSYGLNTFTILSVDPPFVRTQISMTDADTGIVNWAHNLTFKIVHIPGEGGPMDNGLFIEPRGTSSNYIKPWWEVESYVEVESNIQ